jgi:hypothetical protein
MKMCELGLMTKIENLSENFEILKRLNGVYILIFHFAQQRFRAQIKKKFGSFCQRAVPKKPDNGDNAEKD